MTTRAVALSLALWVPSAAVTAPVPPYRPATAETVVRPPRGDPHDLAVRLTSAPFLAGVAKSRPAGWLASRLQATVDPDRGTVTLRLTDCPRKDAVPLLAAVLEAYKAESLGRGDGGKGGKEGRLVRLVLARQVNVQGNAQPGVNGAIRLNESNLDVAEAGPTKAEVDRSVLQPPRVVQPGLPGKGSPAYQR